MALGALHALMEMEKDVPNEMAIMGHDGLDISKMVFPKITTIVQPRYRMGCESANRVIDLIEGKKDIENLVLEPELYIGDTT